MASPATHTAHHAPDGFIRKYVFSLDHKVIGIQYYFLGLFSVFIGMALSLLMRFHMVNPEAKVADSDTGSTSEADRGADKVRLIGPGSAADDAATRAATTAERSARAASSAGKRSLRSTSSAMGTTSLSMKRFKVSRNAIWSSVNCMSGVHQSVARGVRYFADAEVAGSSVSFQDEPSNFAMRSD